MHPTHPGSVNVNTVGWIMVVVGLIAFVADLVLWSSWKPGYMRRTSTSAAHGDPARATNPGRRFAQFQAGMDLRWLRPGRTGVCDFAASTYEGPMVTAAARPHIFWVGGDRQRVRGWPIGPALLEALGEINEDAQQALADERARLSEHGYSNDLPLPALWWVPAPGEEAEAEKALLEAVTA